MVRKVEVVPYDPDWPRRYRAEAAMLLPVLGEILIRLHHIGSTSVPGLSAKPTIDILAEVSDLAAVDACNPAMSAWGYIPQGENGIPGRRYFHKLDGEVHLFHLHAYAAGHPDLERHLVFRDYLCTHPADAREYAALKQWLAGEFTFDAPGYTAGKSTFITEIERKAAAWRRSGGGDGV